MACPVCACLSGADVRAQECQSAVMIMHVSRLQLRVGTVGCPGVYMLSTQCDQGCGLSLLCSVRLLQQQLSHCWTCLLPHLCTAAQAHALLPLALLALQAIDGPRLQTNTCLHLHPTNGPQRACSGKSGCRAGRQSSHSRQRGCATGTCRAGRTSRQSGPCSPTL